MIHSPAVERNQAPVLHELQRLLPPTARVHEIASGTGQHAEHLAGTCGGWTWQPTRVSTAALPDIDARGRHLANVRPAPRLDVSATDWPLDAAAFDALCCANQLVLFACRG
jgi:hypothetical protein